MTTVWRLVGRERETRVLEEAVTHLAEGGAGGLYLVAGDAGAGKTTLVTSVLALTDVQVLHGGAHEHGTEPYGPLRAALRDHLRSSPAEATESLVRRAPSLSLVLPELGLAGTAEAKAEDIPVAIRTAFEGLAERRPTIVFLDDLHWADPATLTLLADWAAPLPGLSLLVIGAYRSDELPRGHPMRSLRARLRRSPGGGQRQIRLGPLTPEDSALLVRQVLGEDAAPEVVATITRRAHGLPFYLEELAAAFIEAGDATGKLLPPEMIPESVRDAVMLRVTSLSEPGQALAEVAAAAGSPMPVDILSELAEREGAIEELLELGLLVEHAGQTSSTGQAAFRHDLVREALYAATPWTRRRQHHAVLAGALEARGASPAAVATHWEQAHEPGRARPLLIAAAEEACQMHAYRDATRFAERALASWPPGEDRAARLQVLDRLGECAERCGENTEAVHAWQEVAEAHRAAGDRAALAAVQRRLAGVFELAADWPRALAARAVAAEEFAQAGMLADAAAERLTAATHLMEACDVPGALRLVHAAHADIDALEGVFPSAPEVTGLRARAMGLEGYLRSMQGDGETGVELTRTALALVLQADLDAEAAEVHAIHGYTLDHAHQYQAALDAMGDTLAFCRNRGLEGEAQVCLACLTPTLRHIGQWDRALEVSREVLEEPDAPEAARMVAAGESGLILANRGKVGLARRRLAPAAAFSKAVQLFGLEVETTWGLARVAELEGDHDVAAAHLRDLRTRCLDREERHYSVAALRWGASYFARQELDRDLAACTDVLARTAAATGAAEATAALAHALGEAALLEGDPRRAADQFERALELLSVVSLPPETAETQVRASVALAAAGDRDKAVERLVAAFHTARSLGASPLAATAVRELAAVGEDVERLLGRRAARHADPTRLTPREREVLRHVAAGRTNRDIASELFLSPRTVDMHVRNLLAKLGCRTRTAAVKRADELQLLATPLP